MQHPIERLRPRHLAVLALIAEGQSNKQIAILLRLSPSTVKGYVEEILLVLGVPNRAAAGARWAAARVLRSSDKPGQPPSSAPAGQ